MKHIKKMLAGLTVCAVLALLAAPSAQGQVTANTLQNLISNTTTFVTASSNVVNAWAQDIPHRGGFAISLYGCGTNASNIVQCGALFALSQDGTNYTTTTPVTATVTANGTIAVRSFTVVPETTCSWARKIKLLTVTNDVANLPGFTITNITLSRP